MRVVVQRQVKVKKSVEEVVLMSPPQTPVSKRMAAGELHWCQGKLE